jgi:hypothetical protein
VPHVLYGQQTLQATYYVPQQLDNAGIQPQTLAPDSAVCGYVCSRSPVTCMATRPEGTVAQLWNMNAACSNPAHVIGERSHMSVPFFFGYTEDCPLTGGGLTGT